MVMMHVWFIGLREHSGEIAGKSMVRPLFLLYLFFYFVGILGTFLGSSSLVFLGWEGKTFWATLPARHVALEFLNVGGWLNHGDLALGAGVDFLAVAEHRLIPARVRSEFARLRKKGFSSIWAPASQDSSHVGNAGVGVVSLRGAKNMKKRKYQKMKENERK